jgi:hypothetical protein
VVYGAALEKRSPIISERGFESHPLRHLTINRLTKSARIIARRGAGVAYQARLESVCSRKVTVGSNPTLSASLRYSFGWRTV